ncbi:MAG TPA: phosphoglucosamine mutase [Bacteroidales bacterium]|nr:phosphoglucosamine mutase [Bacteroidales bacterium]HPS61930.1 phosphoglucosamine mutase [Bacteroidales bacterium]
MALIKSISGIRGTIGGVPGEGLTPLDLVRFTAAFSAFIRRRHPEGKLRIVVGRDARVSGDMVNRLVTGTLLGMGVDVTDIGLTTTPTTELAVAGLRASGGLILTASHNPRQWNALKLLNASGEFLSEKDGGEVLEIAEKGDFSFVGVGDLGTCTTDDTWIDRHIQQILALPLVDTEAIHQARLRVAVDAVNSTGGIAVPALLKALNVNTIDKIHCTPDGHFPHNPEPLPEHLTDLCQAVKDNGADLGFAVDPDVDRLAIISDQGEPFGEEYTLVAVADYVLQNSPGNTVSNLSSTQALRIVTEKSGGRYFASAVGEVNVVAMMKETGAVIGGEGNGGVIFPPLHYGRDALVGIALFLSHLARSGKKCSLLRLQYPDFYISKNKIEFSPEMNIGEILSAITEKYRSHPITTIDGIKIHFGDEWVHLRRSNTEPIVRIYAESDMPAKADNLARKILDDFREILNR